MLSAEKGDLLIMEQYSYPWIALYIINLNFMKTSLQLGIEASGLYTRDFLFLAAANFFVTTCMGGFFLFPLFIKDHGGSEADIGILMGSITISSVLARPWIAQVVDRFGRKKSYFLGTFSFAALPIVYLLFDGDISGYYKSLFAVRVFQGLGLALCFTSAFTMIADLVPPERLNEGLSMFGITGLIGVAIGPVISEPIIRNFGFDIYFITIAFLAVLSLIVQFPLPETYIPGERLDEGVSFLSVMKRKKIFGVGLITVFFGIALATQSSFVTPFAENLGLPNISVYFIAYSVAAIIVRLFGSKLADRVGETKVIPWALLVIAIGFLFLVLVDNTFLLIIAGFITGCGHGFLFPCLNALMIRNEPVQIRGKISGVFTGSIDLGTFLGSISLGYIGEWYGYRHIFIATFLFLMIGLMVFLGYVKKNLR